jgi:hypothetical protein
MEQRSMSEKDRTGVPFASDDAGEQQLWDELRSLEQAEPPPRLRRAFYDQLDRRKPTGRWRSLSGLSGAPGFVTAAACLVAGIVLGLLVNKSPAVEQAEFARLQQEVAVLNRSLILDRLENASAGKRLLGVLEAVPVAQHDSEIARALVTRAVEDRVYSVRSAAIDAIGPQLSAPGIGEELMSSLERSESPLVQLALVDLILRHGTARQLDRLLKLTDSGELHPDVVEHVKSAVQRSRV